MKLIIVFLTFSFSISFVAGQSKKVADELFENFEYVKAIDEYEKLDSLSLLSIEEKERLAYCYYISGSYEKGVSYVADLITKGNTKRDLWLWKGVLEKEAENYSDAITSLKKYNTLITTQDQEVDLMIKSCEEIPTWSSIPKSSVRNDNANTKFSNSTSFTAGNKLFLCEVGMDSIDKVKTIEETETELSEILLMKPYLIENGGHKAIRLFENYPNLSISRIQIIQDSNQIIFSASDILNGVNIIKFQQIYMADFVSIYEPIENMQLWEYSGIKDTSSCAHPTVSSDGTKMIFSKSSKSTKGSDLYMSYKVGGTWGKPEPLTSVNTFADEMFPVYQGDSVLMFSSNGRVGYGGLDIYAVKLVNQNISGDVKHYKAPLNSVMDDFNFTWTDSHEGFFVSNRIESKGDDDVWIFNVEPEDDGFLAWYKEWNQKAVYFDFNASKSAFNDQGFVEGYLLYREKYGLSLKLVGHTDTKGSEKYNNKLGLRRSEWFKSVLSSKGIKGDVSVESVGEKHSGNNCTGSKGCTEEQDKLNRFVQINLVVSKNIIE